MYNADDAIARVDSYIVSVAGGGPYVGQRRLVRIDEVARSLASASLVDNGDGEPGSEDGDAQLESTGSGRRRRGRRGGRGRSRASTEQRAD
jgi:ribonuclease G